MRKTLGWLFGWDGYDEIPSVKAVRWVLSAALIASGFGMAACGPEQDLDSGVRICVKNGEAVECPK